MKVKKGSKYWLKYGEIGATCQFRPKIRIQHPILLIWCSFKISNFSYRLYFVKISLDWFQENFSVDGPILISNSDPVANSISCSKILFSDIIIFANKAHTKKPRSVGPIVTSYSDSASKIPWSVIGNMRFIIFGGDLLGHNAL